MTDPYPSLLSPGRIGRMEVRNRVVMSPMGTNFASDTGGVTERMIRHYVERARGGTGLIIVENTTVQYPQGRGAVAHNRIDRDEYIPGLNRLAEAVQRHGARIAIQLNHVGALTAPQICGGAPVGPSDVPAAPGKAIPRPLTVDEIEEIGRCFVAAAIRAQRAGFDGIELHAAHGYLLSQFLSSYTNRREDEYGGSLENRARFALEVIASVRNAVGRGFPVWMRMNGDDFVEGGTTQEEYKALAPILVQAGLDALHVSAAMPAAHHKQVEPMRFPQGWKLYLAEGIRKVVDVPVLAASVIREPDFADRAIADGKTDFVVIGRGLLADPDWVNKARSGQPEKIRKCISCNVCSKSRSVDGIPIRCTVNPFLGREEELGVVPPIAEPKRVLVIGGGPAGMEAAWAAAVRGYQVVLCERGEELGGQMLLSSRPPGKEKVLWLHESLRRQLAETGVDVRLGQQVTADLVRQFRPDAVILATGGKPLRPPIQKLDDSRVVTAWDVLDGTADIRDKTVTMIGAGLVACETALYLAEKGNRVTMVEMLDRIAPDVEPTTRIDLLEELERAGIIGHANCRARAVEADGLACEFGDGTAALFGADVIVLAAGAEAERSLADALEAMDLPVTIVGDARQPRRLVNAIYEGLLAGWQV
jgi:2,4-dienoyl-CoA reductase-like NADH-dependent reductase (Old Yellow Enzyme family)/thioredoxin reductase